MPLTSMNDITIYQIDGKDTHGPKMRVKSGSRHSGAVDVVLDGKTYTVTGSELLNAVKNAMNT